VCWSAVVNLRHLLSFCLPLTVILSSSAARADDEQPAEAPAVTKPSSNGGYGAPALKLTTIARSAAASA
jgi:hypothetical protein